MPHKRTIPRVCAYCGRDFLAEPHLVNLGQARFCTRGCASRSAPPRSRRPLSERFWEKVIRTDDPFSCWLWQGSKMPSGHGRLGTGGRRGPMMYAHRISWELRYGPIPAGLHVRHVVCRTPSCVRPEHLAIGTHADNMADMAHDGVKKGERQPLSILKPIEVLEIRRFHARGLATSRQLARLYRVSYGCIRSITSRENWAHL